MKKKIIKEIEELKQTLENVHSKLDDLKNVAQDSYDNKSDKWQESEKGQNEDRLLSYFESSIDSLDNAINLLEDLINDS